MRKPLNEWCFRVDQDMMPEWHDAKSDEARARAALDEWFKAKVLLEGCREINSEQLFAFGSSRVEAWGSSRVVARGSSRVVARGDSTVNNISSSKVLHPKERAVVIDRRNGTPVCITSDMKKEKN